MQWLLKCTCRSGRKRAHAAKVLLLTEPWHGTVRVINADAAFASVILYC